MEKVVGKGNRGVGKYDLLVLKPISGILFFINWIENDGTTLIQIVDVEKKTISALLTYINENGKCLSQSLEWTFRLKNKPRAEVFLYKCYKKKKY